MGVVCERIEARRGAFALTADLAVASGASLALLGPSGAGKSMLLEVLAGFEPVMSGRVLINDRDVTAAAPDARPVTMMFQDQNLFPHLTAGQNIALGIHPGLRLSTGNWQQVHDALTSVGLKDMMHRLPRDLPGGQQSRVALARAMVRRLPVLLLDEPFAALGPRTRRDMFALTETITRASGATLIFVTHDPDEARRADVVSFVNEGRVDAPRTPEDLFASPPQALIDYL